MIGVLPVRMLDGMFRCTDRLGWRVGTGAALREGGLVVPWHGSGASADNSPRSAAEAPKVTSRQRRVRA
jgi:hypothetical protein